MKLFLCFICILSASCSKESRNIFFFDLFSTWTVNIELSKTHIKNLSTEELDGITKSQLSKSLNTFSKYYNSITLNPNYTFRANLNGESLEGSFKRLGTTDYKYDLSFENNRRRAIMSITPLSSTTAHFFIQYQPLPLSYFIWEKD